MCLSVSYVKRVIAIATYPHGYFHCIHCYHSLLPHKKRLKLIMIILSIWKPYGLQFKFNEILINRSASPGNSNEHNGDKTGVIKDPLGQPTGLAGTNFLLDFKRSDKRKTSVKIVITSVLISVSLEQGCSTLFALRAWLTRFNFSRAGLANFKPFTGHIYLLSVYKVFFTKCTSVFLSICYLSYNKNNNNENFKMWSENHFVGQIGDLRGPEFEHPRPRGSKTNDHYDLCAWWFNIKQV